MKISMVTGLTVLILGLSGLAAAPAKAEVSICGEFRCMLAPVTNSYVEPDFAHYFGTDLYCRTGRTEAQAFRAVQQAAAAAAIAYQASFPEGTHVICNWN